MVLEDGKAGTCDAGLWEREHSQHRYAWQHEQSVLSLPWETGDVWGALPVKERPISVQNPLCSVWEEQWAWRAGVQHSRIRRSPCVRADATSGLQEGFWFEGRFQTPAAQVRDKTGSGVCNNTWPSLAALGREELCKCQRALCSLTLPGALSQMWRRQTQLLHTLPLYPKLLFAAVSWLSSLNVFT